MLAVAYGRPRAQEESALTDLVFVGFIGIADPPAPGVKQAIRAFQVAGITTDDRRPVGDGAGDRAGAGLNAGDALDGRQVDAMSDEVLVDASRRDGVQS